MFVKHEEALKIERNLAMEAVLAKIDARVERERETARKWIRGLVGTMPSRNCAIAALEAINKEIVPEDDAEILQEEIKAMIKAW